jgi:hypothetical protein
MKKFSSKAKAAKFASHIKAKAVRVKAATMSDGSKGAWYKLKKRKPIKRAKAKRKRKR